MNRYQTASVRQSWTHLRDLVGILVARDFKLRYKRSILGIAWSLLVPVAQLLVLFVVFRKIVPLNIPRYTTFLFTGILPWSWMQASLMMSALVVTDNRDLVKQVGFPLELLPVITVFSQLLHFLLALPILAAFLLSEGYRVNLSLSALPLVIGIQFIVILALAYMVASLQVRFRDTQYLLGIGLFLFFYLTPVFWDGSAVPEPYSRIMQWNPMALILNAYRAILVRGEWPDPRALGAVAACGLAVLFLSYSVFSISRHHFVEEI